MYVKKTKSSLGYLSFKKGNGGPPREKTIKSTVKKMTV